MGLVNHDQLNSLLYAEHVDERQHCVVHEESFGGQKQQLRQHSAPLVFANQGGSDLGIRNLQQRGFLEAVPEQSFEGHEDDDGSADELGGGVLEQHRLAEASGQVGQHVMVSAAVDDGKLHWLQPYAPVNHLLLPPIPLADLAYLHYIICDE